VKNEVRVGLALIAGLVLLVFGTLWLQDWSFGREQQTIEAWFREVGQLQDGNAVKLRGVPIGQVTGIVLDETSTGVIVQMSVASEVRLPDDPVVLLSPESLFGDWQAEIFPRSRFPFYNYAISPEPGVFPGYSLPDVSRLTAVADRIAENLAVITDRVDIAFTEETAVNVREAINNVQQVTAELAQLVRAQGETVEGLAEGLESTNQTFQEAAETAQRALSELEAALAAGELTSTMRNVATVSARMDTLAQALTAMSGELTGTVTSADSSFASLQSLVQGLEAGQGTLGQLLQDTALYRDLLVTSTLIQDLLQDFQRNPQKYINLRVF
jgi:phospholipid/cholesterol/gamma-HCH transport system substrate-binding protein